MSAVASKIVIEAVNKKPASVLGLATGSTPLGLYKRLVEAYKMNLLNTSLFCGVNLDEYVGLGKEHSLSYHHYMFCNLYKHIGMDDSRIHIPNGLAEDLVQECADYDAKIQRLGGIDLQVLGTGANGHIGFNEPADYFTKNSHVANLHENTRSMNARFFENVQQVPNCAITIGIGAIMNAKSILILASGCEKTEAINKAFYGKITPQVPASILQLHSNVTLIADKKALAGGICRIPRRGELNEE